MDIGSSCSYTDKCIYFVMEECSGINHQNCPTKADIISGVNQEQNEATIKKIHGYNEGINGIKNKRVLITGGAGSFGTAFCLYLKRHNICPEKVIVMSRDVLKHNELKDKLGKTDFPLNTIVCNVTDLIGLEYATYGVDIILHAAAIKYIVECEYNARQTLAINCDGTQNIVDAAIKNGVKKTLLISTDKSVSPLNIYGISKAMAERIIINGNNLAGKRNSKFSVCRYGNVINSNGSIIPVYKKMIVDGARELPITHPEMTRFFYKMDDACKLVLDALEIMQGGETYIPKIPSVKIINIPAALGMPYYISGIRPGEKLHECMIPKDVSHLTFDFGGYYMTKPAYLFKDTIDYDKGGVPVPEGFEYNSKDNEYLTVSEIKELIEDLT